MKTLLLLTLLSPVFAFAQTKKQAPIINKTNSIKPSAGATTIQGLGKFKIGKTTIDIIQEIEKELEAKIQRVHSNNSLNEFNKGGNILEILPDTASASNIVAYASLCPSAKVYLIPAYKIADLYLAGVKLTFLNGVLVEFYCDGALELLEALSLKYGKPTLKVEEKGVPCVFTNTGQKITYKNQVFTNTWPSSQLIATAITSKYYDDDCQEQLLNYFTVFEPVAMEKIRACERATVAKRKAANDKIRKQKLRDL